MYCFVLPLFLWYRISIFMQPRLIFSCFFVFNENKTLLYDLFIATGTLFLYAYTAVWAFKGSTGKQYNMLLGYMR